MPLEQDLTYGAAAASTLLKANIGAGEGVSELLKKGPAGEKPPKEALQLYAGMKQNTGILLEFFRALDLIETEGNRNAVDMLRVKVLSGLTMADVIRLAEAEKEG